MERQRWSNDSSLWKSNQPKSCRHTQNLSGLEHLRVTGNISSLNYLTLLNYFACNCILSIIIIIFITICLIAELQNHPSSAYEHDSSIQPFVMSHWALKTNVCIHPSKDTKFTFFHLPTMWQGTTRQQEILWEAVNRWLNVHSTGDLWKAV